MSDINYERYRNGAIGVSSIRDGHLVTRIYYGYTVRQAVKLYKQLLNGANQ